MFEFRNRFSIQRQTEGERPRWLFRDSLSPRSARVVEDAALQLDTREDRLAALRMFNPAVHRTRAAAGARPAADARR
ncbi:MAG: hypothetical protein NT123_24525 [Proteobacteria bacterium]|nr:hypothetical protein [Pseudomonadota bacterium]